MAVKIKSRKTMKINMITDGKFKSKGGQVKIKCLARCGIGCPFFCYNNEFFNINNITGDNITGDNITGDNITGGPDVLCTWPCRCALCIWPPFCI